MPGWWLMPHSEHIQNWTKLLLPTCSPYPSVISPFTVKPRSLILYPSANHASPTHHSSTLHSDQLVQAAITSDPGYHNSLRVCLLHLFAALNIFSTEQPGEGSKMRISLGRSPASNFPVVSHLIEDKNVNKTQSLLPPTFLPRWWPPSLCSSHTNFVGFLKHTSMILPQGLCTCCLCLECCPSRYLHGSLLSSFSSGLSVTISERLSLNSLFRGSPVTFYPLRQLYFSSQYLPLADITSWFLYCLFLLLQYENQEDGDFFFFLSCSLLVLQCLVHNKCSIKAFMEENQVREKEKEKEERKHIRLRQD